MFAPPLVNSKVEHYERGPAAYSITTVVLQKRASQTPGWWKHLWTQEKVMDTRKFLEEHEELLPKLEKDREAIIREAYSEKIDTEATWAFWPPIFLWLYWSLLISCRNPVKNLPKPKIPKWPWPTMYFTITKRAMLEVRDFKGWRIRNILRGQDIVMESCVSKDGAIWKCLCIPFLFQVSLCTCEVSFLYWFYVPDLEYLTN